MRRSRLMILFLLAILVLALAAPAASAKARHTDFHGLYFPAGMPGTGTACPYTWVATPGMCVIDPGDQTVLPSGRLRIRDMTLYELALAWTGDGVVEPRKTGYDIVLANANLDDTFSGPTWGTWELHSFAGVVMFTGTFTGKFLNGVPAVHYVGLGTGIYEGQHMRGNIGRVPDPWNMFGEILEPGSL